MARKAVAALKVPVDTHAGVLRIAREEDVSVGELVTQMLKQYETRRFWQGVREDIDRLKQDPAGWQAYMDEIQEIDAAGIDDPTGQIFGDEE